MSPSRNHRSVVVEMCRKRDQDRHDDENDDDGKRPREYRFDHTTSIGWFRLAGAGLTWKHMGQVMKAATAIGAVRERL